VPCPSSRARAETTVKPTPSAVQRPTGQTVAHRTHLTLTAIPSTRSAAWAVRATALVRFRAHFLELAVGHAEKLQHVENVHVLVG
jgi:hypothetical protein